MFLVVDFPFSSFNYSEIKHLISTCLKWSHRGLKFNGKVSYTHLTGSHVLKWFNENSCDLVILTTLGAKVLGLRGYQYKSRYTVIAGNMLIKQRNCSWNQILKGAAQHTQIAVKFFRHSTNFLGLSHIQAYLDGVICHYPKLSHPSEGCCPQKEVSGTTHKGAPDLPAHTGVCEQPHQFSAARQLELDWEWWQHTNCSHGSPPLLLQTQRSSDGVTTRASGYQLIFVFHSLHAKSTYSVSRGNDMTYKLAEKIEIFVNYKTLILLCLEYSELHGRKYKPGKEMTYTWQINTENSLTELLNQVIIAELSP